MTSSQCFLCLILLLLFIGFTAFAIPRILVNRKVLKAIVDLKDYVSHASNQNVRMTGEVDILRAIVKRHPLEQTLTMLCRFVEKQIPGTRCSVLILDPSGKKVGKSIAPSLPTHYNKALIGLEIGPNIGSCGAAMFLRRPVIISDIATHPNWLSFRDLALPCGLRACWSMPAINGAGKVLGAFAIYSDTPRTPAQNELMVGQIAVELSMIAVDTAQTQERLASQAMHDDLTQLPNRRYIGKLLTQKKSARDGLSRDGFLLLIDLDDFKPVNDTYGHLTGDEVLKEVAQRLLRIVCEEDTVARMGGDEFMIVLNGGTSKEQTDIIASRIIREVSKPIEVSQHKPVKVGCSIGIVSTREWRSNKYIFDCADKAMYSAKSKGKNRFEYFEEKQAA